jgi:hypothetical protein
MVAEKKVATFFDGCGVVGSVVWMRESFAEDLSHYTPESVPRMHVEKSGLAAFW